MTLIESRRQILLTSVSFSINVNMFTGHAAAHKEEQEIRADDAEKKEPPGTNPYLREDPPRKERGMSCFRIFHDAGLYGMSLDASQKCTLLLVKLQGQLWCTNFAIEADLES